MKDPLLLSRSLLHWLSVTEFYTLFVICVSVRFILVHIPSQPFAYSYHTLVNGARVGVVVKALRYKPADRGFDSGWCHWNFSVT